MAAWGESIAPDQRKPLLEKALALFVAEATLIPIVGMELEFFLTPDNLPLPLEAFLRGIQQRVKEASLPNVALETERGNGQYEIQVDHSSNVLAVADAISQLPSIITEEAANFGLQALFDAKPHAGQPGSSLHIHVGLYRLSGENALMRVGKEPFREESSTMRHAIGGLLATMQEALAVFAPTAEDYARFKPKQDAPTTVSWGGNNRTVALRIPASSWLLEPTRHVEHRVPAANADPYLAVAAILAGIHHGLLQKIEPSSPKIYGDASLAMYKLEPLASSLEEALRSFEQGMVIKPFFARCM